MLGSPQCRHLELEHNSGASTTWHSSWKGEDKPSEIQNQEKHMTRFAWIALPFLIPSAFAGPMPVTIDTPVHVYVPKGFDTNDSAQIVIEGYLPNLCYRAPFAEVEMKDDVISVTMKAYFLPNATLSCAMVIVPFVETVDVGTLTQGPHRIEVNGKTRFPETASILIEEAVTHDVDNHVYADIRSIQTSPHSRKVVLRGTNPSNCFQFDRFETVSNGKDAYSVLPIMKQVREDCPIVINPYYTLTFEVPKDIDAEKVLLHVRTMNGKSANAVYHRD
jgi:hypothetical protein